MLPERLSFVAKITLKVYNYCSMNVHEGEPYSSGQLPELPLGHPENAFKYEGPQGYAEWGRELERLEEVLAVFERTHPDPEERKALPDYNVLAGQLSVVRREYFKHSVVQVIKGIENQP